MISYDYIIAGSGASGLLIAYRMSMDMHFDDKKILLLDKVSKNTNDRTWCYWEKGPGEWDHLTTKTWNNIYFKGDTFAQNIALGQYQYKMLRSSDLYAFLYKRLYDCPNFEHIQDEIIHVHEAENSVIVKTNDHLFVGSKVFNSCFDPSILKSRPSFPYLKQHFIGWFVQVDKPVFDANTATFMDFSVLQKGNTRFMYVLPISTTEALVEYTLFSEDLLPNEAYESEIVAYLSQLGVIDYTITEKEQGNIPMTSFPFERLNTENILNIGSAGGWTKASTGYTFANATKKTRALIQFLKTEKDLRKFDKRTRYWYFDLIFLGVLHKNNELGASVFSSLFRNNTVQHIFRFLDEEGTLWENIKIMMRTQPKLLFMKSALRNIGNMINLKI